MMERSDPEAAADETRVGRRVFLGVVAGGVSSLFWGDAALRAFSSAVKPVSDALPASVRAALPAPSSGWRIYAINPPFPTYDAATWRLKIDGMVGRPTSFTLAQLKALPRVEQISDFHCVTGWSVPNVHWAGVRFKDLLAAAAPKAGATALTFTSMEVPYVDTLTMNQALLGDVMVAYEMDGRPLTREHGAPVRVVMPKMYGYKGVKWLSQITLTSQPQPGFWEQRGYDTDAWVGHSNGVS
jgi:DMSO/TMAO reductase YedYZ molybdopterin-dependent catalytic subunit